MNDRDILLSVRSSESLKPEEIASYYVGFRDGEDETYTHQVRHLTNGTTQVRFSDEEWRAV